MRSYLFAYALLLTTGGCFHPDLANVTFTCDPTGDQTGVCPEGQVCSSQGDCVAPGMQSQNPDLAGTPPATLGPAEGCPLIGTGPGQGFLVSAASKSKVFACPVKYNNKTPGMTADAQCRAPYTLCNTATNIDPAACSKAGQFMNGFFIGNVKAYRKFNSSTVSCTDPGGGGIILLWGGCGRTATALKCQDFTAGLDCYTAQSSGFQCSGTKIGDVTNNDGSSGVLCCAP